MLELLFVYPFGLELPGDSFGELKIELATNLHRQFARVGERIEDARGPAMPGHQDGVLGAEQLPYLLSEFPDRYFLSLEAILKRFPACVNNCVHARYHLQL